MTSQMVLDSDGRSYEQIVDQKQSTLRRAYSYSDNVKITGHFAGGIRESAGNWRNMIALRGTKQWRD